MKPNQIQPSTYQPFQPNAEERAFLYQQAQAVEPLVSSLGSMTLLVEESTLVSNPEEKSYAVTFVVAPEAMDFRVRAEGRNLFEACIKAKDETQTQLNALVNALPAEAFDDTNLEESPEFRVLH